MADAARRRRLVLAGVLGLVVLVADLWSKSWAWHNLRGERRIELVDGFAYFEFGFNTGAAFSLLADTSYARFVFLAFSIAALLYIGHVARKLPTEKVAPFVAISGSCSRGCSATCTIGCSASWTTAASASTASSTSSACTTGPASRGRSSTSPTSRSSPA
jgi:hypothetical protein